MQGQAPCAGVLEGVERGAILPLVGTRPMVASRLRRGSATRGGRAGSPGELEGKDQERHPTASD